MLVEGLIRLGRPFVDGGAEPVELLRQVSDVTDVRARNFFQRVFVVEMAERDGARCIFAHPQAAWGHMTVENGVERFQPDEKRVIGVPFVLPRGNPTVPQGRYPAPIFIVYDKDFRVLRGAPKEVERFLKGRLSRTIGVRWPHTVVAEVSAALAQELDRYLPHDNENCLAVIFIADLTDSTSPYLYDTGMHDAGINSIPLCESRVWPGRTICADVRRLLERVWIAKAHEGAEMGSRNGACSVCGKEDELVSIYSKAWSWFSVTWTAPLPGALSVQELVEGIGLCPTCYAALTVGAQVFSDLAQAMPNWLTKEIFSPVAVAQDNRKAEPDRVFGTLMALPVLEEFLESPEQRASFVRSVMSMRIKHGDAVQRHLDTITGFEARLPVEFADDRLYRLQIYYYSGDVSRGDVYLRGVVEDVVPSVASAVDELLRDQIPEAAVEAARQLGLVLNPLHQQQLCSLPYLLATAFGSPYLWQVLADVLHRRPLGMARFVSNAAARMQSLTRRLPDAYRLLQAEVLFYLVFTEFARLYHEEIAYTTNTRGRVGMRPWQELQAMLSQSTEEVHFEDVEELGFACGHLTRQFSRWYYKKTGKDFLRHRVMTFGSDLTPDLVWQRAISKFGEYRAKLWREGGLPRWFERLMGVVLMEFSRRREEVRRERAAFMAAFWAGYCLQAGEESDPAETDTGNQNEDIWEQGGLERVV